MRSFFVKAQTAILGSSVNVTAQEFEGLHEAHLRHGAGASTVTTLRF
jgi:hypothetical protein